MEINNDLIYFICLSILSMSILYGFFKTKTSGFGRYSTSALLLIIVLIFSSIFLLMGKIESSQISNIIFAIIGYAGGLIVDKKDDQKKQTDKKV